MKLAVIGGGPSGLYLAILVKRRQPDAQVLVLEQNGADSTFGFGVVLADSGQISESIQHFEAALHLHPEAMTAHSNLLLTLHYDPAVTPNRLREEHQRWAQRHAPTDSP